MFEIRKFCIAIIMSTIGIIALLLAFNVNSFNTKYYFAPKKQIHILFKNEDERFSTSEFEKLIVKKIKNNKNYNLFGNVDSYSYCLNNDNYQDFNFSLKENNLNYFYYEDNKDINSNDIKDILLKILKNIFYYNEENITISIKEKQNFNFISHNDGNIGLFLLILIINIIIFCLFLIFMNNYHISRILSLLILTITNAIMPIIIMLIFRIHFFPVLIIISFVTTIFTLLLCLFIMQKDKFYLKNIDNKNFEQRKNSIIKITKDILPSSLNNFFIFILFSIFFCIIFNFKINNIIFYDSFISCILSFFTIYFLYAPITIFFDNDIFITFFSKIKNIKFKFPKLPKISISSKHNIKNEKNEDEDEEIIFAGIND